MCPNRRKAMDRAKVYYAVRNKDGSISKRWGVLGYKCEGCGKVFPATKDLQVHHIEPVGNILELTVAEVIEKMFCSDGKLMVLCKECHAKEHGVTLSDKPKKREKGVLNV